jgi:alpha-tubulin suppressor-like RCC1 family protein
VLTLSVGLPVMVPAPAGAAALGGIRSISAGTDVTCAVLFDTTARCWGYNTFGQIGDGTKTERWRPVVVKNRLGTAPLKNVAQISVGTAHVCALIRDGTARCWGQGGELGDGTGTTHALPVVVKNVLGSGPLPTITQISAGGGQTCARLGDGTARCWGLNGALGNGSRSSRLPVKVLNAVGSAPLTHITQISVGNVHSCARMTDGTARCWGINSSGELGDGTTTDHFRPVKVLNGAGTAPLGKITQIVASYRHTCARISDATARCWGFNGDAQLGNGTKTDHSLPVRVVNGLGTGPLQGVSAITTGRAYSCTRMANATARCWGARLALADANNNPTSTHRLRPTPVMDSTGAHPMTGVAQIDAGTGHTCVRKSDSTARCFGENGEGELGDGTKTTRHFPVLVG